jgi:predicted transcriptional regulator
MQVTSIRFEQELKDRLKELAGNQGYQALIRDILWNYVHQRSRDLQSQISRSDIRATVAGIAQKEELCVLTGKSIHPQEPMLLGLITSGEMVPISRESLESEAC